MSDEVLFYTVRETAERLRVSEQTVRRWYAEGKLAGAQVGRRVLVDAKALDRRFAFVDVDAEQRRREHAVKDRQ